MINKKNFFYRLVIVILLVHLVWLFFKIKELKKEKYFTSLIKLPETIRVKDHNNKEIVLKLSEDKTRITIIFFRPVDCSVKIKGMIRQMKRNRQLIAIGIHENKKEFWRWMENYNINENHLRERIFFLDFSDYHNNYFLCITPIKVKLKGRKIEEIGGIK